MRFTHKTERGFTLIELMIALAIVGILTASALPNMRALIQTNTVAAETSEVLAALHFARGEAIKRGTVVIICPSIDARNCIPSATVVDWKKGWVVRTPTLVLRHRAKVNAGISFTAGSPTEIRYEPNGLSSLTATASLNLCVHEGAQGRKIKISATGRPYGDRFSCEVST